MNEQLKSILMLPFSKRVIIAVLTAILIFFNKKWGLGLEHDDIVGIVVLATAIIVGLSVEQSAGALADAHVEANAANLDKWIPFSAKPPKETKL